MEHIKDFIHIITKRRLQNIKPLDQTLIASSDSILTRFYNGIEDGTITTERDAVIYLYGDNNENNVKSFRQLKSRFRKRLMNTLFFLDIYNKDYKTEAQRYYFECVRSLQIINIIQKFEGNWDLIFSIINDYFKIAEKYEFYDILFDYSSKLANYYSLKGMHSKFDFYKKKYNVFKEMYINNSDALMLFNEINCLTSSQSTTDEATLKKVLKEFESLHQRSSNFLVHAYYKLSVILTLQYTYQNELSGKECDEFLHYLEKQNNGYKQSFIGITNMLKISNMLQTKTYHEGILYIDKNSKDLFGINWFEAMDIKFKFALNLEKIELAEQILNKIFSNKLFNNLPPTVIERWYINEGYFSFYHDYLYNKDYKYNISKLINQVQIYFHDKSGYNFSLQVLQLLFYMAKNDMEKAITKINNLKIYKTRYFKDEKYIRTIQFIKSLFKLEKLYYQKSAIDSLSLEFKENTPKDAYIHNHEIIAYETLLDIVTELYNASIDLPS